MACAQVRATGTREQQHASAPQGMSRCSGPVLRRLSCCLPRRGSRGLLQASRAGPRGLLQLPTGDGPFPCALGKQAPTAGVGRAGGAHCSGLLCLGLGSTAAPLPHPSPVTEKSAARSWHVGPLQRWSSLHLLGCHGDAILPPCGQQVLDSPSPSFTAFLGFFFWCVCLFV